MVPVISSIQIFSTLPPPDNYPQAAVFFRSKDSTCLYFALNLFLPMAQSQLFISCTPNINPQ